MRSSDKDVREAVLRVSDVLPCDVGECLVRVPAAVMRTLDALPDDVVELHGSRATVARVAPLPASERSQLARMQALVRQNAGSALDGSVTVRRAAANAARSVVLTPADARPWDEADVDRLRSSLLDRPVVVGDRVEARLGSHSALLEVQSSAPQGPVVVTAGTKIVLADVESESPQRKWCSYEDIGGLDEEVRRIREMVELPLRFPDVFRRLGVEPPKGVLLHGAPGTGKTLIARAVANESKASFIHINGPEIVNKLYGESEARLRELFEAAQRQAPAIIFIDELDAIAPRRTDDFGDVEKRIVAQLLALMDGLTDRGDVVVIGATNVPHMIDPALRRPGRFDREISVNPPDRNGRAAILAIHARAMRTDASVDLARLADVTHGFVGADLAVLCKEAGMSAIRRALDRAVSEAWPSPVDLDALWITQDDFERALRETEPTALREVYADHSNAILEDVGGLRNAKDLLTVLVNFPSRLPPPLRSVCVPLPRGVLLTGRPGTGKTLLVHALAGSNEMHLISVTPAVLISRWYGETQRGVREIFKRAKQIAPCILFFDELDTLAPSRESAGSQLADQRLVSQLCVELDHLIDSSSVVVAAATSRPEEVDPSLMRPGRFDLVVDLPLPTLEERCEILAIHSRAMPLAADVRLDDLASMTDGCAGADLSALCRYAMMNAARRWVDQTSSERESLIVSMEDFRFAVDTREARIASSKSVRFGEQCS